MKVLIGAAVLVLLMVKSISMSPITVGLLVDSTVDIIGESPRELINEQLAKKPADMIVAERIDADIKVATTTAAVVKDWNLAFTVVNCPETRAAYLMMRKQSQTGLIISILDNRCFRPHISLGFGFPVLRGPKDIVPLIVDLRRSAEIMNWDNVIIVHDESIDLNSLEGIVETFMSNIIADRTTTVTTYNVCLGSTCPKFNQMDLKSALTPTPTTATEFDRYYLIIGQSDLLAKSIELAQTLNLMGIYKRWLMICTNKPEDNLWEIAKKVPKVANVAIAYRTADTCEFKKGCELTTAFEVLSAAVTDTPPGNAEFIRNTLRKSIREKISVLTTCGACARYTIRSVVVAQTKTAERVADTGSWTPYEGLDIYSYIFPVVGGDFRGQVVKVGVIQNGPESRYKKDTKILEGLVIQIVKELEIKMNFTAEYVKPVSETFGVKEIGTNKWSGLIGLITNNEVDFVANGMYMTKDRLEAVNFTHAIDEEPYLILTQKPDQDYTYLFLAPFTWDTWVLIIISIFMMGPMIYMFERFSKYYDFYELRDNRGLFLMSNCAWYVYGAVVQQGGIHLPLAVSSRVLVGFWWIFVIVTVTSYSGNLVAVLTFPKIVNPITNVDDVLSYSRYLQWGAFEGEALIEFIGNDKNAQLRTLSQGLKIFKREELNYTLNRVKHNRMVMLLPQREVLQIIQDRLPMEGICNYGYAAEPVIREVTAMAVPKGWPYLERMNNELKILIESGLIIKWQRQFWPRENQCTETSKPQAGDTRKISIAHMWGSFIVLFFGFGSAVISFIAEMFYLKFYMTPQPGHRGMSSSRHLHDHSRNNMKKENLAFGGTQNVNTIYPATSKVNLLYDADEDVPEQFTYTAPRDNGMNRKMNPDSGRNKKRRF